MQKMLTHAAILVGVLVVGGCSTGNFIVYKNGSSFYISSDCPERQRVLCDSGDINKVVTDSKLPDSLQKELKDGMCASGTAGKPLAKTLERMTKEQRTALKDSFLDNGYEINKIADS